MNARIRQLDPTVLDATLERAHAAGRGGVVVFDLDSTLLDNRPRQARIVREFGAHAGLPRLAAALPEHWNGWDIRVAMRNAGLSPAEVEAHAEAAKEWWRERFFTSEYCRLDEPIDGAVAFTNAVLGAGAQIAYCTGRHEAMRAGTVECFARVGFPLPDGGVALLMKPTFEQTDDDWKNEAYARLRALGRVLAVFDNEPTHVNGYRAAFDDAICVHLATDDSGRDVVLLDGVRSIHDFRR